MNILCSNETITKMKIEFKIIIIIFHAYSFKLFACRYKHKKHLIFNIMFSVLI